MYILSVDTLLKYATDIHMLGSIGYSMTSHSDVSLKVINFMKTIDAWIDCKRDQGLNNHCSGNEWYHPRQK